MARGIVIGSPTATGGRLVVAQPDGAETGQGTYLDYDNKTGKTLAANDVVKFTLTSETTCDADELYTPSQGKVDVIMYGDQQIKDKVRITQLEEINYGLETNKVVIFDSLPDENGQYPGPPPSNWGDTIEFVLTGGTAGAFVRVVSNA